MNKFQFFNKSSTTYQPYKYLSTHKNAQTKIKSLSKELKRAAKCLF